MRGRHGHACVWVLERPGRGYRLERCQGCGLPDARCLCSRFPRLEHDGPRLSVIAARGELVKPSNTARLLSRWLHGVQILERGRDVLPFDNWGHAGVAVLFPSGDACELQQLAPEHRPTRLIVPDGIWSQARRIVRRELAPRGLPFVCLPPGVESRYGLRRRSGEGLCTFEAVVHALGILQGPAIQQELARRFDVWTAAQREMRMGGPVPPFPRSQVPPFK